MSSEKILREYVREILVEQIESEPDLTRYVDDLEYEIFLLLFDRNTFDHLRSQPMGLEVPITLSTDIFAQYDNINEVHLGVVLVEDSGVADVQAAYVCVPEERHMSNLMLSISIPGNYPQIEGFQEWLSTELADALSHEIQHSCDTTEMLTSDDCGDESKKWDSLENIEKYYGCEAETRGHVAGILGRARRTGQDVEDLLGYDVQTVMMKALERGYKEEEMIPVVQRIYGKWSDRLEQVMMG